MLNRRTRGISTSRSGGAVLVSSRPYPPPRLKGRVAEGGSRAVPAVGESRKK